MTKKKIILNGSIAIGKFMGETISESKLGIKAPAGFDRLFEYNSSWDWIMPVYKKVIGELLIIKTNANESKKHFDNKHLILERINEIDISLKYELIEAQIEGVFEGIVGAIIIYELYKDVF